MTWIDLHKQHTIINELTGNKVTRKEIKELIELGEDYLLKIILPLGEFYKVSEDDSTWGICISRDKIGEHLRSFKAELKNMGLSLGLVTDEELTWTVPVEVVPNVLRRMKSKIK